MQPLHLSVLHSFSLIGMIARARMCECGSARARWSERVREQGTGKGKRKERARENTAKLRCTTRCIVTRWKVLLVQCVYVTSLFARISVTWHTHSLLVAKCTTNNYICQRVCLITRYIDTYLYPCIWERVCVCVNYSLMGVKILNKL